MKFLKNSWYNFTIERLVEVPQAGYYYRLLHESGQKFLLPAKHYTHYNLAVGSVISCRVDKINCMGKVFLEPKHPYYELNRVYNFDVTAINESTVKGIVELVVKDIYNEAYTLFLPAEACMNIDNVVSLRVFNIKKGRLQLQLAVSPSGCLGFKENEMIELMVEAVVDINGENYFFLAHSSRCFALMKVKHYHHYGFEVGKSVSCQYIAVKPDGTMLVEPPNPFYKVGSSYSFTVDSISSENSNEGEVTSLVTAFDVFGMKCGFSIPAGENLQPGQTVLCRVTGYKKGRPLLAIVQK